MTEIIGSADCGNSPKNTFVQDVAVALEVGAADAEHFDTDVVWTRSSAERIVGRVAVIARVKGKSKITKITIEHAISHGKVGAANGEAVLTNGQSYRFCHVIAFTNAKANCVAAVVSYG